VPIVARSKGVSRVLTEVLIVIVVLSMAASFAAQQMGLLSNLAQTPALDMSASQAWVNPVDGSGQMLIKIRNSGTGTLRIKTIIFVGTKVAAGKEAGIDFKNGLKPSFYATGTLSANVTGNIYSGTTGAGITSDGYLFVPAGAQVTLEFTFTANLNNVFDAGSTYKVTVATSGEVFSSKLTFSG
jgi:hypothetical protein